MKNKKIKDTLIYIIQLIVMVVVTYFIFTFIVRPIKIVGPSMTPTVTDGDFAITNVIGLRGELKRFDVVVIDCEELNEDIIKRIIGLPGEVIEYKNDQLYVDGVKVSEDFLDIEYIEEAKKTYKTELFTTNFTYTVPEGEYFVLGDNRLNSRDSRNLGTFSKDQIVGKGGLTIFPFNHFRWIK